MKELIIVKVGNENHPASETGIEKIRKEFKEFCESKGIDDVFVTHHAIEIQVLRIEQDHK